MDVAVCGCACIMCKREVDGSDNAAQSSLLSPTGIPPIYAPRRVYPTNTRRRGAAAKSGAIASSYAFVVNPRHCRLDRRLCDFLILRTDSSSRIAGEPPTLCQGSRWNNDNHDDYDDNNKHTCNDDGSKDNDDSDSNLLLYWLTSLLVLVRERRQRRRRRR